MKKYLFKKIYLKNTYFNFRRLRAKNILNNKVSFLDNLKKGFKQFWTKNSKYRIKSQIIISKFLSKNDVLPGIYNRMVSKYLSYKKKNRHKFYIRRKIIIDNYNLNNVKIKFIEKHKIERFFNPYLIFTPVTRKTIS